jgi:DNA-binding FrmR family transcriptional regulator
MKLPEEVTDDLVRRLRRIEGQIRGLQQMLLDGRECRDIVTQVSAASRAVDQVGFRLLAAGMAACLNDESAAADAGLDLAEVEKLFLKLA